MYIIRGKVVKKLQESYARPVFSEIQKSDFPAILVLSMLLETKTGYVDLRSLELTKLRSSCRIFANVDP